MIIHTCVIAHNTRHNSALYLAYVGDSLHMSLIQKVSLCEMCGIGSMTALPCPALPCPCQRPYMSCIGCKICAQHSDTHSLVCSVLDLEQGGWEWTSTPFAPLKGFEAMSEYPEYSTDFFDGCHYVVKGSSPYTHASLIRRSFRNYYQKEYPYVFAKFRMCKDAE